MRLNRPHIKFIHAVLAALLSPLLCQAVSAQSDVTGLGDPNRGKQLIEENGCGACHQIPGIPNAKGLVGPPLEHMARRTYLAGVLHNSPDNMTMWLMNPQDVIPGVAMPDMGLSEEDARDIASYLLTLQ